MNCKVFKVLIIISVAVLTSFSSVNSLSKALEPVRIANTTSSEEIHDPLVIELLNSVALQRLKHIDQHGPAFHLFNYPNFSRYNHSIGVYLLTRKFSKSREEQITALLHDVSHSAFSHTADYLFNKDATSYDLTEELSYQDKIHNWYLKRSGVDKIVKRYALDTKRLLPDNKEYKVLDQPYPDMCADRIQYNVEAGVLFRLITQEDAKFIFNSLRFEDSKWYFVDKVAAKKFSDLSLNFTENLWSSVENNMINIWFGKAIRRALDIKLMTDVDVNFGYDEVLMNKLKQSEDKEIKCWMKLSVLPKLYYRTISEDEKYTYDIHPKFRGIDPWVKVNKMLVRLTDLDEDYKKRYSELKNRFKKGFKVLSDEKRICAG